MSRQHARLSPSQDGWILTDLGSANGTFYRGHQQDGPVLLKARDTFSLASIEIEFKEEAPKAAVQFNDQKQDVLKAVVSMRLIPRADGHGRVPAAEVMITTPFIRDCIINKDKTKLIHEAIAAGVSQYGMQTFDQSIFQLYKKELISYDEALRRASNPDEFKLKIQGIQSASDMAAEEMEQTMQSFDLES